MSDPAARFHDFERDGWQDAAVQYDAVFQGLTAQSIVPLIEAVAAGAGTRLVDLASGPGYVAAAAEERGATALAIDFAQSMVAIGRIRHPRIELRTGDVEALALPDGCAATTLRSAVATRCMITLARLTSNSIAASPNMPTCRRCTACARMSRDPGCTAGPLP